MDTHLGCTFSAFFRRYHLEVKTTTIPASLWADNSNAVYLRCSIYKQNQKKEMSFAIIYSRKSWMLYVMSQNLKHYITALINYIFYWAIYKYVNVHEEVSLIHQYHVWRFYYQLIMQFVAMELSYLLFEKFLHCTLHYIKLKWYSHRFV